MRIIFSIIISLLTVSQSFAQQKAKVSGKVVDENDQPLQSVSIQMLNKQKGTITDKNGEFKIDVPAKKPFALVFSFAGYQSAQKNFLLNIGQQESVFIKLEPSSGAQLQEVTVKDDRAKRGESGTVSIDAQKSLVNPSPLGGIESLIKVFVGSNNELTSQYSVRGGSYDENLIYVNDFEVFRPYLVSSGQQEGLSFINPEMTGNVKFYNGGYQAKYGDKMSSVLDITYKKPKDFSGSAYVGLLEQGLHLEGVGAKGKVTYNFGVRNRSTRNLLSSQETKGNYIPSSSDLQGLITYQASEKWLLEVLANVSATKFTLYPESSKLTSSVFSNVFSANLGLDIYFQGQEKDKYATNFVGLSATFQPRKNLKLKWMLSRFNDTEEENKDITAAYLFGERDFDKSQASYGLIVNPLGAGVFLNYGRNSLNIDVWNASHKGSLDKGKHFLQWGNTIEQQVISDKLNEWQYSDSAGYSLPYNPSSLQLYSVLKGKSDLNVTRFSGYIQDNIQFKDSSDVILQVGARYNYNTLNNEFLVSPRMGISLKPKKWQKDIILKASAGIYDQPPFYREMRRYDGTVNTSLKAQKSWQVSAGLDYNFKLFQRPARLTTEAYYKNMTDVVPYDVDNVRIRYFGENSAKAYAVGVETRLYGELVKDAESWVSIGLMNTKEKIDNFFYEQYKNAAGEIITASSTDQVIADSIRTNVGYVRRPTDRLITFGLFFQDYMSTNKNLKFYMNALYGSNLPYNIPNSVKYRNALTIEPYIRVDMGFSALLLDGEKAAKRSHSPFKNFTSIWASVEVFNIIDRANTISYLLIKDFQNNIFTIPNRLTPRLINLKLIARF
ncbi:carboxypeptidase-like regulatory domain-containing protein [Parasediminibacterium paludis]|uniref:Carboxypeptidase-like regulatory domain-containing protein n=1 Tax=Parasediminibacterium paludis TaxID=908966 RepID=A0ABV8PZI3_9BACT